MLNFNFKKAIFLSLFFSFALLPVRVFSSNGPSEHVDNFGLLDEQGQFHQLYYYANKKAIVLIVQGNGCPIIRENVPYLKTLQEQFEAQGVTFLMINPNLQDDRDSIKKEVADFHITIPVLEDKAQIIAEALHLTRTAEALVINPADWTIVYRGAISDQFGYNLSKKQATHPYLQDAIEAVLKHQSILNPHMEAKGCLINYSQQKKFPSYNKDIVPILLNKCVLCHSPGGIAPWSMDRDKKIEGRATMIREVVRNKRMPPWQADPYYGQFQHDFSLSPVEIQMLVHWIEQGAMPKEEQDILANHSYITTDGWPLGKPDLIFKFKNEQKIPAAGSDQFRFIEADQVMKEDAWVKAIYWQPGNKKIVHHGNLVIQTLGTKEDQNEWLLHSGMDSVKGQMIDGYSPGTGTFILPDDTGFFVPKGAKLFFKMHYIITGKPETDNTRVGLYLYKNKPAHVLSVLVIANRSIKIPAGDPHYPLSAQYVFKNNITLFGVQPHMHYRGKSMRFTVEYPNGTSEILLSVPDYKFRWQHRYLFQKPKKIPAGSRMLIDGFYDNSAQNQDNPDPTQEVVYGPTSGAEMFSGILYLIQE